MGRIREFGNNVNHVVDVGIAQSFPIRVIRKLVHGGAGPANKRFVEAGIARPVTLDEFVNWNIYTARREAVEALRQARAAGKEVPEDFVTSQVDKVAGAMHGIAMQYVNQNPGNSARYARIADQCHQCRRG